MAEVASVPRRRRRQTTAKRGSDRAAPEQSCGDGEPPYFFCTRRASKRSMVSVPEQCFEGQVYPTPGPIGFDTRWPHRFSFGGGTEQNVADILGISPGIVRQHYAKWTPARQERITTVMRQVHSGTFLAQTEKEAVIN